MASTDRRSGPTKGNLTHLILFCVKREVAISSFVKRDLDLHFTTLKFLEQDSDKQTRIVDDFPKTLSDATGVH